MVWYAKDLQPLLLTFPLWHYWDSIKRRGLEVAWIVQLRKKEDRGMETGL